MILQSGNRVISDATVEKALFIDGVGLDDYCVVDGATAHWGLGDDPQLYYLLIEDAALRAASVAYLRLRGAREYATRKDAPVLRPV